MSAEIYTPTPDHLDAMAARRLILWEEEAAGAGLPPAQIAATTGGWSEEKYRNGMQPKMEDPDHYMIRALGDQQGGTVDGIFVATRGLAKTPEDYGYENYLESIQLARELRGKGYAYTLMRQYFDFLGPDRLVGLHVFPKNERAKRFYATHGFAEAGSVKWNIGGTPTVVLNWERQPQPHKNGERT